MVAQTPENLMNSSLKGKRGAIFLRWKRLEEDGLDAESFFSRRQK